MSGIESLARGLRATRHHRARRRTRLPAREPAASPSSSSSSSVPHVYVLVPDDDHPSGGIRVMYRHVDLLAAHGVPATVLHQRPGFRCSWFDHDTPVRDVAAVTLGPADLLVVGELDVDLLVRDGHVGPHVVLNQSGFLSWGGDLAATSRHYRDGRGLRGAVVVSDEIERLLVHAYRDLPVRRVRLSIDPGRFGPVPRPLARRIAYMPRRGAHDAEVVLELLRSRGVLEGWDVVRIAGLSHAQVADELRRADIFVALSPREGFGLPAAEAMACGSYVVGFHGVGGREFFLPRFSAPVESGDLRAAAVEVERAIRSEEREPGWIRARGLDAARHVLHTYSPDAESTDVVSAYAGFLDPTLRQERDRPWPSTSR